MFYTYGENGRYFKGLGPNLFPHVMIGQGGEHPRDRTESFLAITQDSGEFDSDNSYAKVPINESPAPVVSIAFTDGASK